MRSPQSSKASLKSSQLVVPLKNGSTFLWTHLTPVIGTGFVLFPIRSDSVLSASSSVVFAFLALVHRCCCFWALFCCANTTFNLAQACAFIEEHRMCFFRAFLLLASRYLETLGCNSATDTPSKMIMEMEVVERSDHT